MCLVEHEMKHRKILIGTYEVLFYMKKSVQIIKVVISKRNFDKLGSEGQYKFTKKVSKLAFPKKVYNF